MIGNGQGKLKSDLKVAEMTKNTQFWPHLFTLKSTNNDTNKMMNHKPAVH